MNAGVHRNEQGAAKRINFRRLGLWVLVASLFLLTGCVSERESGTSKIFTIELWVSGLILILGLIAAPAGWMLRETSQRFAWILMVAGPIMVLGVAPSLFMNKTTVTPDEITVRSGIWGMTGNHHVKYDNLNSVRLTTEVSRGRRGSRNVNHYLVCECKDGTSSKLSLSNDCTEKAAPYFLAHLQTRGIPIADESTE
jgi:hypothetical protein